MGKDLISIRNGSLLRPEFCYNEEVGNPSMLWYFYQCISSVTKFY